MARPTRRAAAAAVASASRNATPKWKMMVWTGCFAAVVFTGSIYGAGIKTRMEQKQVSSGPTLSLVSATTLLGTNANSHAQEKEKKKVVEASTDAQIAVLEGRRAHLFTQKVILENKLSDLQKRMEAKQKATVGGTVER
jgi:hypothetical protein